jgi:U3 small nucleolar RNA-associated protein 10
LLIVALDAQAVLAPTKKQARITAITAAALELLPHLPFLLDASSSSPTTRQAALLAIDALVLQFGTTSPSTIAATLPPIITTCSDVSPAVRASALTSVANIIRALGHKVVAHVPSAVRAILAAANSSAEAIAEPSLHPEGNDGSEQSTAQQHSFVLAAALAALQALVEHTAALMSPYIAAVLQLLLRPEVLECTSQHCSAFSTRLRHSLPASLSPRVLLGPLHDQLGPALAAGAKPATALLEICTAAASAMDSRSAAAYHEKLFSLFLTALEVRQTQPSSLLPGNGIYEVESEAVRGAVALVMKLSEANFKPLFLALMEWTNDTSEPAAGAAATQVPSDNMGRICAMMSLVEALAHRLRSVFVPYFRYLLDVCVHFLTTGAGLDSRALKRLKKKRRESLAADENGSSPPVSAVDLETSWVLRAKIVRSLHRCFLYDSVAFLDQDRFNRLLHPLIAQLDAEPPVEVVPALTAQCGDKELDACVETTASLDMMGRAVVGCLAQMATSAGSDALWKPLNQQVLMMTRSTSSRTRLLGLEVSSQLIGRLREEFLVLLPESIPFLAELLEDSDVVVERRTQEVVKVLEELSGEKLDEYMK